LPGLRFRRVAMLANGAITAEDEGVLLGDANRPAQIGDPH
jgi:hypothetical protein